MTHEKTPHQNNQPEMIEVPEGFLTPEQLQNREERDKKTGAAALRVVEITRGDVISVAPEDFKGDTSKVLGHPDNDNNRLIEAAQEYITKDQ